MLSGSAHIAKTQMMLVNATYHAGEVGSLTVNN